MRKTSFFSSFALKIIAIVLMTIDDIGLYLHSFSNPSFAITTTGNIFRSLGRLAMPLFIFMIVEGVLHTKSIKKYLLRLGIIAFIISAFLLIITVAPLGIDVSSIKGIGNIFLDLLLTALTIYILDKADGYKKLFILLPVAISIISFFVKCYEKSSSNAVLWYPNCLYLQYDWVSLGLGIGFYFSKKLADSYVSNIASKQNIDRCVFDNDGTTLFASNIISVFFLFIVLLLQFLSGMLWTQAAFWDYQIQTLAIFAGIFILFYNGKRGYNAKWFQYGCYIYYPLHMIVLFILYLFIH